MCVSIIIPVYNKENNISNTIQSVLSQDEKNFELLLIDDGSTDESSKIMKEFSRKDSRVKYFHKKNNGVSSARNFGISLAQKKYISFLDADDEWHKSFLSEMLEAIGTSDVCYCGHYNKDGKRVRKGNMKFFTGNILIKYINNVTTPNTNSWLINKSFIHRYGIKFPENVSWGEDMSFFIKILSHCEDVQTPKKWLSVYNNNIENSLSSQDPKKIYYDLEWIENSIKYIENNIDDESLVLKSIEAFSSYRRPASIIYRLDELFNEGYINLVLDMYLEFANELKKISITNGLRSIKLILRNKQLKRKLKMVI